MRIQYLALVGAACLFSGAAQCQSGFLSADGKSRYPGVTVFCASGDYAAPCNFGGGGGGLSNVTVDLGGAAVASANPFPVMDSALDGLVTGGALKVGGSVSITGTASVSLSGAPSVSLTGSLPAGTSTLGTVNLGTSSVGSVSAAGTSGALAEAVQGITGGVPLPVSGSVAQAGPWNVGVSFLPALAAGSNLIGNVGVAGAVGINNFPASQAVTGTFWQATQPVSVASLPLPAGAALDSDLIAPDAPVAPGTATATKSLVIGCLANTTLPSFTAGQEGAVPCDTSGRPYVVTVPSANNVPGYLQAVSSGGASTASAVNAAASCMATSVKTTSGMVYSYSVSNSNTGGVWFRLFASATAPACGSGTPAKRIYVPAGATIALATAIGWVFGNGVAFDVTSGSGADNDTATVAAANSVLVNIDYK
jgi:hypothetical protein